MGEGANGGGGYIEMDLGLGVLEEKREGGAEGDGEDGSDGEGGKDSGGGAGTGDVLGDMMGKSNDTVNGKGKGKVVIEEIGS